VQTVLAGRLDTDIGMVQELLCHSAVRTTMIYTHVLKMAAGMTRTLFWGRREALIVPK
jgi:integrase